MDTREFEINRRNNYTIVDNSILRSKEISLKATGLLCKMYSLPPDWDYSFNGLVSICSESKAAVRSAINELKRFGYIDILKEQNSKGLFVYKYKVFDTPQEYILEKNNPAPDFPAMDCPTLENQQQLNTNKLKTKEYDKYDKSTYVNNSLFLNELIKSGYITIEDNDIKSYYELFNNIKQKYSSEDIYTSIHYITSKVKINKFRDEDGNEISNKFGYFNNALKSNLNKLENMKNDIDLYGDDFFNDILNIKNDYER